MFQRSCLRPCFRFDGEPPAAGGDRPGGDDDDELDRQGGGQTGLLPHRDGRQGGNQTQHRQATNLVTFADLFATLCKKPR